MKDLHKEVHWHTFHNIRQQEGEGITHFLAKLQSRARLCEFTVKCTNGSCQQQVNYSEDMLAGHLDTGLLNTEHQGKILRKARHPVNGGENYRQYRTSHGVRENFLGALQNHHRL